MQTLQDEYSTFFWSFTHLFSKRIWERVQILLASAILSPNDNEALAYCRTALDQEPFMEEIHRLIMQLHHQRGDRAAAILQYQQLQTALEKELGIPPSPATTLLVEKIKSA